MKKSNKDDSKYAIANLNACVNRTMQKNLCITRVRQHLDTYVWGLDELVRRCIIIDACKLASDPLSYIEANLFQYMVAICLWILLTQDVFKDMTLVADLRDALANQGLAEVVNVAKQTFSNVLHGDSEPALWKWLTYPASYLSSNFDATVTTWFRFLSRFTPIKADKLNREAEKLFFDYNDEIEQDPFQRKWHYLERAMSLGPVSKIRPFSFDRHKFMWSNGTCNDGSTVAEKLRSFSRFSPHLGHPMYPLSQGNQAKWEFNVVTPLCVPKSLKTPRIIAPVSSYTGAMSHQLRIHLTDELMRITGIDLSCQQDINKRKAQAFSCSVAHVNLAGRDPISFDVATVDESRASDSIPWSAYTRIFPQNIVTSMKKVRENVFVNKYRYAIVQMAFASGNPSTFVSETWFFYSCAETACWYYAYLGSTEDAEGKKTLYLTLMAFVFVYGDDVIIPSPVYETFVDILAAFGIAVSRDKSYTTGAFRESCGGEYVNGSSVDSHYWPRKEVCSDSPIKAAFMLTSLHNHLFNDAAYRNTHRALKTIIQALYPKMTCQRGFEYSDLHDDCAKYDTRVAPVGYFYNAQVTVINSDKIVKEVPKGMDPAWLSTPTKEVRHLDVTRYLKRRLLDTDKDIILNEEGEPCEYHLREVHTVLSTVYGEYVPDNDIEMLLYVDFLQNGPYYETKLDEYLGVSTPRLERRTLTQEGREVVKRVF